MSDSTIRYFVFDVETVAGGLRQVMLVNAAVLAVLVAAREEEALLAAEPVVADHGVDHDGRVRVADVGLGVHVVNRRGVVDRSALLRLVGNQA